MWSAARRVGDARSAPRSRHRDRRSARGSRRCDAARSDRRRRAPPRAATQRTAAWPSSRLPSSNHAARIVGRELGRTRERGARGLRIVRREAAIEVGLARERQRGLPGRDVRDHGERHGSGDRDQARASGQPRCRNAPAAANSANSGSAGARWREVTKNAIVVSAIVASKPSGAASRRRSRHSPAIPSEPERDEQGVGEIDWPRGDQRGDHAAACRVDVGVARDLGAVDEQVGLAREQHRLAAGVRAHEPERAIGEVRRLRAWRGDAVAQWLARQGSHARPGRIAIVCS